MAIKGATFDLQTVLAKYDGAMYNALSNNHNGYVSWTGAGNPITFTDTNVLTLKNGYILVHGRLIVVDGATDITLNPGSSISSGDGRLVLQIDTSKTNTQTVLNQVEILQEYKATSASWRALSTDDINALSTGVYEVQLCHFTVANGTSSGVQIDISTDTLIGNLQDDIETLADNLEQTASDVGDLQALGLSVPIPVNKGGSGLTSNPSMLTNLASTAAAGIFQASPRPGVTGTLPIANGGTGASTAASARTNLGVMPLKHYQSSDSWSEYSPNLTHIENIYTFAGETSIVDCYFTGNTYRCVAIVNYGGTGWGSLAILERPQRIRSIWSFSKVNNTWYETTSIPRIMRWTYAPKVTAANSYVNYQTTGVTTLSGQAFSSTGADAWNVHVTEAGLYRVDLKLTAPTGSGFISVFTGNNATPNYTGACQTMPLSSAVGRLSCSEVMSFTANQPVSFIVRCSITTDELAGWMTLEKLS